MPNTRNTKDLLLGSATEGFLVGTNTLCAVLRSLAERSRSYRKTRDISIPVASQFSALILEQVSLLSFDQLLEIKALLFDWKVKEAAQKPFDSYFHPDGRLLTESEKVLQQLADILITAVCEEHSLATRASYKRGKVHGSRDAFEFQHVEQAKAEAIKRIHELTSKISEILQVDAVATDKATLVHRDSFSGTEVDGWGSSFFKDLNEKEFEVGLCAVLLMEKLETEKKFLGDKKESLHHSVIELKEIFKIKDLEG
jgi:hypothetical protein